MPKVKKGRKNKNSTRFKCLMEIATTSKSMARIARENGVCVDSVYDWRDAWLRHGVVMAGCVWKRKEKEWQKQNAARLRKLNRARGLECRS